MKLQVSWMLLAGLAAALVACATAAHPARPAAARRAGPIQPDDVQRVPAATVKAEVGAGQALLVCAYDDADVCKEVGVPGAGLIAELRPRLATLPRTQTIYLFCA